MRRFVLYLPVAALTFCVGSLAQHIWLNTPEPAYRQPRSVTLCELTAAPEQYDGEEVLVRAALYRNGGEPYVSDNSCASPAARVNVRAGIGLVHQGLPEWATYTTFCGSDPYSAAVAGWAADVIIIGTFNVGYPEPGGDSATRQPFIVSKSYSQITRASKRQ
jgi:hypothetical protein